MNVLLVSEPGVDGVFRHVEQLVHYLLAKPGLVTHLAYSSLRGGPALEKLVATVAANGGRTLDLRVGNAPRPEDARAFFRLWRLARDTRPEVIHAHSSKAGVLARALAVTGVRAKYFYTPHAYYKMNESQGLRGHFYRAVESAFGSVGTTVNISETEAAYGRRQLGIPLERQRIFPNGVDCECFRPLRSAEERRNLRVDLNLPPDALLLGTVARLTPQKDPHTLYSAVLAALAAREEMHFLHLNATGELAGAVEEMLATASVGVQARVHRRPAVEDPARYFQALDAFILPSRYEGLSFAALEAGATNLPFILSDCPGNADLRAHAFNLVRWSPTGDVAALTQEILGWAEAAGSAPAGLPLPCNHREVVRTHFAQEHQFARLLRCYTEKLG